MPADIFCDQKASAKNQQAQLPYFLQAWVWDLNLQGVVHLASGCKNQLIPPPSGVQEIVAEGQE